MFDLGKAMSPTELDALKNPFASDCISRVSLNWGAWSKHEWRGRIEFENGDTKGEQGFTSPELGSLIQKMETFAKTLDT